MARTPNYNLELVNFNTIPWHTKEHDNWRSIDAIFANFITVNNMQGVWQNATAVTVGQRFVDPELGSIWTVLVAHTTASTGLFAANRTTNPTYWSLFSDVALSESWAIFLEGLVNGEDYSSKAYAVGTIGENPNGSAKYWQALSAIDAAATAADLLLTNADVVLTNADVVSTNADAASTAADVVSTGNDVTATNADVVSTNADVVSTNADVVTTAAAVVQAQAAAYGWTTVTDITAATTNLETTDARKYYILDATSNTIAINLPAIGTDEGILYAFEVKNVDNAITIVRDGTDYINGANGNYSGLVNVGDIIYVTSDDNSPDNWLIVFVSRVPTATTTTEGKVELATAAELTTGTDAGRAITPDAFTNATNIVTPAHVAGAENAQTGTTYAFVLGDAFKQSTFSNASAVAVTLPLNSSVAFADADRLDLVNLGAGTVTFTAASGVTINGTDGGAFSLAQWKGATLLKTGTDAWAAPNQTVA